MIWPPSPGAFEGAIVRLEPIDAGHRDELAAAAREHETWTWLDRRVPGDRTAFDAWFDARVGATPGKHLRMPGVGVWDSALFSITEDDWPEVSANLTSRLARAAKARARA